MIDILIALIKSLHLDISIPVVGSYMIGNIYIVKKKNLGYTYISLRLNKLSVKAISGKQLKMF